MEYAMVIQAEREGFSAFFPDLPGCFSEGDTLGELMVMAEDAVATYLSALREAGDPIPRPKHRVATVLVPSPGKKVG